MRPPLERTLLVLLCVALALPLAAHAWAGMASRYVGDDYCAGYIFRDEGLLGGQRWFYLHWGAVPTVLALMALTEPGGARLASWLPAVALGLWIVAGAWAVRWIAAAAHQRWSAATSLFLAELVIFVTLQDAPNVIQSLYLRVPMLAYTGPLIFLSLYIGFLARAATRRSAAATTVALSAMLAFVGGSFGPVFVALQTTALVVAAAVNAFARRGDSRSTLQRLLVAGLAGSLAGLAFVALAPGNTARQRSFPTPPTPLLIVKWSVLSAVFMFIRPILPLVRHVIVALIPRLWGPEPSWLDKALEMSSSPLTILALVTATAWLALARAPGDRERAARRAIVALIGAPIVAFVLVLASMTPGAYGTSAPPPPRALVIPQFAIACLAAGWGYALGMRLRCVTSDGVRRRLDASLAVAASCLVIGLAAASLHATLSRATTLRAWAVAWDATDKELRATHDAGQRTAVVPAVADIGGVGSIGTDADGWVNACAARYYGLDRITGTVVSR